MNKVENSLLGLIHPVEDSTTEVLVVKQCLQELGFSETDQAWLVAVFKRRDCFGDPNEVSIFNDEFSVHFAAHILRCTMERVQRTCSSREKPTNPFGVPFALSAWIWKAWR